jgi:hypothetical protein
MNPRSSSSSSALRTSLVLLGAFSTGVIVYGCGSSGDDSTFGKNGNGDDPGSFFGNGNGDGGVGDFQDAAGLLEAGCATATARAARQPVYMLIALDGSGSMDQENKWVAVVPALDAFFDDLKAKGDTTMGVGLTVFSDERDKTKGQGPYPKMDVPIQVVDAAQATALHGRIDTSGPKSVTPTLAVLQGQYPLLESFQPSGALAPGGKRVLVLMTDGNPFPHTQQQQPACISLAQAETAKGILTFAVGIGDLVPYDPTTYDPTFMGAIAKAGGTASAGCDPNETSNVSKMCHFQITPGGKSAKQLEQDFLNAIDAIRGAVASCEFTLDKSGSNGQNVDPTHVNVVYDDGNGGSGLIPEDGTNGWTYDDPNNPSKVILHGASCDQLKANPKGGIKIVLGCRSITK